MEYYRDFFIVQKYKGDDIATLLGCHNVTSPSDKITVVVTTKNTCLYMQCKVIVI